MAKAVRTVMEGFLRTGGVLNAQSSVPPASPQRLIIYYKTISASAAHATQEYRNSLFAHQNLLHKGFTATSVTQSCCKFRRPEAISCYFYGGCKERMNALRPKGLYILRQSTESCYSLSGSLLALMQSPGMTALEPVDCLRANRERV